jgi:hypothetical protein
MHTASDRNYDRGYEWWLMEQAKARNPRIKLAALPWGAPHWVGNGNYWSRDMIYYMVNWLKHARSDHHLRRHRYGGSPRSRLGRLSHRRCPIPWKAAVGQ